MKQRKNKNKKLLKLASKFKPWDWGYMIALEKQMLKQMQEYHANSNITVDNPEIARQIKWALRLLDIADETKSAWHCSGSLFKNDGNYNSWIDTYVNTKNWKRFISIPYTSNTPDFDKPHIQDHLRQRKAWYIYNKLRFYHLQWWWD